jgi:hypothetical protein
MDPGERSSTRTGAPKPPTHSGLIDYAIVLTTAASAGSLGRPQQSSSPGETGRPGADFRPNEGEHGCHAAAASTPWSNSGKSRAIYTTTKKLLDQAADRATLNPSASKRFVSRAAARVVSCRSK